VERADQLITKLADENEMWKVDVVKKKEFRENIVGDIIVCSGIVAYLGVFTENYRVDCVKNWIDMLREFEIKSSPEVAIQPIMGNPVKIR
jgi:dynein heavy chain